MEGGQKGLPRREDPVAEAPQCELKEANADNIKSLYNTDVANPLHILTHIMATAIQLTDREIKAQRD